MGCTVNQGEYVFEVWSGYVPRTCTDCLSRTGLSNQNQGETVPSTDVIQHDLALGSKQWPAVWTVVVQSSNPANSINGDIVLLYLQTLAARMRVPVDGAGNIDGWCNRAPKTVNKQYTGDIGLTHGVFLVNGLKCRCHHTTLEKWENEMWCTSSRAHTSCQKQEGVPCTSFVRSYPHHFCSPIARGAWCRSGLCQH